MAPKRQAGPPPRRSAPAVEAPAAAPRSDVVRGLMIAGHLALAGLLAALVLGLLYVVAVGSGYLSVHLPPQLQEWDTALYRWINHLQQPDGVQLVLTLFNDPGLDYTMMIAPCLAYLWVRRRREVVFAALAIGATLVIGAWTSHTTSQFGFRPRPFVDVPDALVPDFWRQIWVTLPTFPSGHLRELSGVAVILAYFWPKASPVAALFVPGIGFTRVYLGAHYPLDVGGGIVLGTLSGAMSLVVVGRLRRMLALAAEITWARNAYQRLLLPTNPAADALVLRAARCAIYLGLLLLAGLLVGYPIHTDQPGIISAYMRNVDNSVLNPVFALFDVEIANTAYWILGNSYSMGAALACAAMVFAISKGRGAAVRAVLTIGACLAVVFVFAQISLLQHSLPRPLTKPEFAVAESWQLLWPGASVFPIPHVVLVTALITVIATTGQWLRLAAYACLLPLSIGMLYFGAAWPTQIVASLALGYLCGRFAASTIDQLFPRLCASEEMQSVSAYET